MNDERAAKLLGHVLSKKPDPDGFIRKVGMPGGGDIPEPRGAYTHYLIGPGVWPSESESAIEQAAEALKKRSADIDAANDTAKKHIDQVFSEFWTAGDGAAAASAHYDREYEDIRRLSYTAEVGGRGFATLANDFRQIKRLIRDAHDEAHEKIEEQLRNNGGREVNVGAITSYFRVQIDDFSAQLHDYVELQSASFTQALGLGSGPADSPAKSGSGHSVENVDDDSKRAAWGTGQEDETQRPVGQSDRPRMSSNDSHRAPMPDNAAPPESSTAAGSRRAYWPNNGAPGPAEGPPSPHMPGAPHMPSLPTSPMGGGSMPGMGQGMPLGLVGRGVPSVPSTGVPGAGNPTQALSSAAGQGFGRGLMAGSGAASAMPNAVSQPVPHTPAAPLAAPSSAAVPSAAAPAAAVTAPAAPAAAPQAMGPAVAAPATGGGAPAAMSSYGTVIPPSTAPAGAIGGVPGGVPAASAGVPGAPGGSAGAGTGFVPVREPTTPVRVSRDAALSDLDEARRLVGELAAASSVVDPGLGWAVGVGRSASGGTADFWVATNEGNGYIPAGVFMRRTMPLAAAFDIGFDSRWFGWAIPGETVARAIEAQGLTVTAVASSGPSESDMLREKVRDVAFRVAPTSGPEGSDASRLSGVRSHRLETVEPGLYYEMSHSDHHSVDAFCRELTVQAAFYAGPELSPTAQAVAQQLISNQWPSVETWEALRDEYAMAVLMAGSQRPGFSGFEDPEQMQRYIGEFVGCRRVETLLCWETGVFADIVYAARAAGVTLEGWQGR